MSSAQEIVLQVGSLYRMYVLMCGAALALPPRRSGAGSVWEDGGASEPDHRQKYGRM